MQLAELRDTLGNTRLRTRHNFGKGGVHVGEGNAGPRKIVLGMRHYFSPRLVERRRLAIDLPAPQKRCCIGQIEQGRRVRHGGPYRILIQGVGALGLAARQFEQRKVP